MKKILSLVLSVVMVFSMLPTAAFAAEDAPAALAVEDVPAAPATEDAPAAQLKYVISTNEYMTRLHTNLDGKAEFELGFVVREDNATENQFNEQMGQELLEKGKIQINSGKEWTFAEAQLSFANKETKSSYASTNSEFIKEFYEQDSFEITVVTPKGEPVKAQGITNQMTPEERAAFKESLEPGTKPQSQYTVDTYNTFLKDNWGTKVLRIDFNEFGSSNTAEKNAYCEKAVVKINDHQFGTMKEMGFEVGAYFDFELSDLTVIKDVIKADNLNIELTDNGTTTSFTVKNDLTAEQRDEIAGGQTAPDPQPEPEPETKGVTIGDCQVMLVNSGNHAEESMSGPTLNHEGQMITNADGEITVVLHFQPAVIMDILAYATDLRLVNHKTEFVLRDDNSGLCIVHLPAFTENEQIYDGHIFSSVMDADIALKVTKPSETSDLNAALKQKVSEIETMLQNEKFYESTTKPVLAALENAKNPQEPIKAYTELLKAAAGLRKIAEDPFKDDTIFHVEAVDTSIVGKSSLEKYVKVEIVDGKKFLTAHYNSYLEWDGLIYMDSIQVLDHDGKEIPATYTLDENKNGTLRFEMPYVPDSGIFDLVLSNGNEEDYSDEKLIETKLQMDYATIVKGPFKTLLQDAIDKYAYYTDSDWSTRVPMENRKDDYTTGSWNRFADALKQCQDGLNSGALTQQQIDEAVQNLRQARLGLVYQIKTGSGDTANAGTSALNNPAAPYYPSDPFAEYPEIVGWSGSKVVFGNDGEVYRVLNIGEDGKILLMADSLRVRKQFAPDGSNPALRWSDSVMRKYLNGEFYQNNFSDIERKSIVKTQNETYDYETVFMGHPAKNPDTLVTTEDYIFAPSMEMVTNEAYGYGSNDSRISATIYGLRDVMCDALGDYVIMGVDPKGRLDGKYLLQSMTYEAPPCMYVDAGNILMTVDAAAGIPEKMTEVEGLETNLWKLVMHDESLKLNDTYQAQVNGSTVRVDLGGYKGDVMAVVVEGNDFASGTIKAYGKVDAAGFQLSSFDTATQKLYVLAIRDEDDKTAYASQPALVNVDKNIEPGEPEAPEFNKGTVTITMNKDGKQDPSMCDVMFAQKADVEIHGDMATVKLYVAYPVPAFAGQGKDGTLKNFTVSYDGKEYVAASDIETQPQMTVKGTNPLFGLIQGKQIPAQILTLELPKAALNEQFLNVRAFVNVFMHTDVDFDMALSDLVLDQTIPEPEKPEPEKPEATTAAPVIAPNGGRFKDSQQVVLSCDTEGAVIYYTLDGSEPTADSLKYTKPFTLTETATVKAAAQAEGMKMSAVVSAEFTKEEGGDKPAPDTGKFEDGVYKVDVALWHEKADKASMGDAAFASNRKALVTVKNGKITTVQLTTGPVKMGPITSAITYVAVNGETVEVLKTEPLTTTPNNNQIEYIKQFSFQLPDDAQPEKLAGVTYVPVQFKVPDTPMGDTLMDARIKLDWSTAEKNGSGDVVDPTVPQKPDPELTELDLEDKETGIKVHADKGVFTEKVYLIVKEIKEGSDYDGAAKTLSSVGKKFKLYEIHFENEKGEEVQPEGMVTVSYKIPDGYDASKLAVYRVNENGTKTLVNGTVKDGYYVVVQKHFSTYALVETGSKTADSSNGGAQKPAKPTKPRTPHTGDETPVFALVSMLLVSTAAVVVLTLDKKRRTTK